MTTMIRVVVESPFAGYGETPEDVKAQHDKHMEYLHRALKDCDRRNESPHASHLIGPYYLNDNIPAQRQRGILAGFVWLQVAQKQVFYTDLGWSNGMRQALIAGQKFGISQEFRALDGKVIEP